jgi:hypothetical protein
MASLARRLQALEAEYAHAGGGSGEELRPFMSAFLKACAHIRREYLDRDNVGGFRIDLLHGFEPWHVAAYVAALAASSHRDEAEGWEILAAKGGNGFERLITLVVTRMAR